jgi:peptidyl-tRNA hydrolase, PTH1 family
VLLLVGLGNPGAKYAGNRHNVGFRAVDAIAQGHGFGPEKARFQGLVREGVIQTPAGPVKAITLKPQTFYNESVRAVQEAASFYKLEKDALVVFHDELDLAPGRYRIKQGGGLAGNNGLRSVASRFGPDFLRGRIGIGHPGTREAVTGYVLSDFHKVELPWVDTLTDAIARALPELAAGDLDKHQTRVTFLSPAPELEIYRGLGRSRDRGTGPAGEA